MPCGFESHLSHQKTVIPIGYHSFFMLEAGLERALNKQSGGLFVARGRSPKLHNWKSKKSRPGTVGAGRSMCYFSPLVVFRTILVRANRAMALGMTIRLLNISVSSQTKSLDIRVPRKINTRAITM